MPPTGQDVDDLPSRPRVLLVDDDEVNLLLTAAALRERLAIDVTEWDERLSTAEASRFVHGKERRAKGDLDSAAAAVILQAVLDSRRSLRP